MKRDELLVTLLIHERSNRHYHLTVKQDTHDQTADLNINNAAEEGNTAGKVHGHSPRRTAAPRGRVKRRRRWRRRGRGEAKARVWPGARLCCL
jgi:hypothetical protein